MPALTGAALCQNLKVGIVVVEIFVTGHGKNDTSSRMVASELRLEAPSDIHFGSASAGIAFYEKSGADLSVTLLDGAEILVRDFFVIGPSGDYSRLLLSAGGEVEITGLVAPEPLLPRELPEIVKAADLAALDTGSGEVATPSQEAPQMQVAEGDMAPSREGPDSADAAGGGHGFALDKVLFFGSSVGLVAASQGDWGGGSAPQGGSGAVASRSGGSDADYDPELAALIGDADGAGEADDGSLDDVIAALGDREQELAELPANDAGTASSGDEGLGALLVDGEAPMALDLAGDSLFDALLGPVDVS